MNTIKCQSCQGQGFVMQGEDSNPCLACNSTGEVQTGRQTGPTVPVVVRSPETAIHFNAGAHYEARLNFKIAGIAKNRRRQKVN